MKKNNNKREMSRGLRTAILQAEGKKKKILSLLLEFIARRINTT